jgi:predicted ATPase
VFEVLQSPDYGSTINNDFITKRLQELPPNARKLCSWACLLGGSFSFALVKTLMDSTLAPANATRVPLLHDKNCAVTALNAAVGAFVLMAADDDDRFRFSHDRYLTAAASSLDAEWDTAMMHYMIAKVTTTSEGHPDDSVINSKALYTQSRHICLAVELIKARESERAAFRGVLYQAAETACDSGARSTGIYYYAHCLLLLQDDPWGEDTPDVSYQETLQLFVRAAECYWHQGMLDEALSLIRTTFKHARDPEDMASSFILQSRVYAVRGDSFDAFESLKECCSLLGTPLPPTTWEECDAQFQRVCAQLQSLDKEELLSRPLSMDDRTLMTLGPVAVELLSAAFWSNSLLYYQCTLLLVDLHLSRGTVSQVALGYVHLGSVAGGRFNRMEFAVECGTLAKRLIDMYPEDHYTYGHGQTLHSLFLGHLQTPISALDTDLDGKSSRPVFDRDINIS